MSAEKNGKRRDLHILIYTKHARPTCIGKCLYVFTLQKNGKWMGINGSPKIDKRVCVCCAVEGGHTECNWMDSENFGDFSVNGSGMSLGSALSCGCNMLLKDNRAAAHVQSQRGGNSSSIRSECFIDCWDVQTNVVFAVPLLPIQSDEKWS